ncbi:MAG: CopG family ribbon-helix-helix protein [Geminicoccales bacterium]
MAETTFTFRVDEELKSAFSEVAKGQDRTAAQLLRVIMRDAVRQQRERQEYDAWFRSEVEKGLHEADDPSIPRYSDAEVRSNWRQQRAELMARARGKKA